MAPEDDASTEITSREILSGFVDRLVRLATRKQEIAEDEKIVKAEAKEAGMNMPALNVVVRERLKDTVDEGQEGRSTIDRYHEIIG